MLGVGDAGDVSSCSFIGLSYCNSVWFGCGVSYCRDSVGVRGGEKCSSSTLFGVYSRISGLFVLTDSAGVLLGGGGVVAGVLLGGGGVVG